MKKILIIIFCLHTYSFSSLPALILHNNNYYFSPTTNTCPASYSYYSSSYTCASGHWPSDPVIYRTGECTAYTSACIAPNYATVTYVKYNSVSPTKPSDSQICPDPSTVYDSVANACTPPLAPTITGELTLDTGTKIIHFSDESSMYVLPDGTALAWDIDGNEIPNREYNGAVPALATFEENQAFDPNSNKKYIDVSFNGLPVFLIQKNGAAGFHGSQLTPIASIVSALGMMAVSPKTVSGTGDSIEMSPAPTPEHPNAKQLNVTKMNFDNVDFSEYENKATSTPQQIPDSNLLYEKIMDATRQAQNFPSASLGDTVIYENSNPSSYVNVNPNTLEVATVQPDKSVTEITFDKNSFENAYNSDTGILFSSTTISAPQINNDGSTSVTTTTTSQGFITSETTVTTDANGSTSFVSTSPSVYNSGGGVTSVNGTPTNIDLSGVTTRLDKISNQLTKQNERNDNLDKIDNGAFTHDIPTDTSAGDLSNYTSTLDTLQESIDDLITQGDTIKSLFENGFSPILTGGELTTCPYNSTISLNGSDIPVSFDLCRSFAPMRPLLYTMFYLFFVVSMVGFSFKLLFRIS